MFTARRFECSQVSLTVKPGFMFTARRFECSQVGIKSSARLHGENVGSNVHKFD